MMDFEKLMQLAPGDKMVMTFTKNPKPSWLSQQTPAGEGAAAAPTPNPAPGVPPMAPPSLPTAANPAMMDELSQRMGPQ